MKNARLYGIVDLGYVQVEGAVAIVRSMIDGGVGIVQLRAKGIAKEVVGDLGLQIAEVCRGAGVPFVLNDHPDLVGSCGADGVHVGQDDLSVAEARGLVGTGAWVGKSTHSLEQAREAVDEGVDYIGFGPLFPTPTKPDYQAVGLADVAEVVTFAEGAGVPVFCIGGVKSENLGEIIAAGARRVVIVSGILLAADPEVYCREVVGRLECLLAV